MKKIVIIKKSHACNKNNFDSNINEVIRPVLNFLLFFYEKISHTQKAQKSQKAPKAQKAQKAQKRNQAKVQNATSKQKQKMRLKNIKREKSNFFDYLCFSVFFVRTKNRK